VSGSNPDNKRHPDSTFSTEYPYNQATVTRSGHEFHINDAPDNESLKVAHTTGTYVEIEKTGRWVHTVVEKVYNYFKDTFTQTIDSHADIKIGGTYCFNVDKSSFETVALKKTTAVGDDLIDGVGGVRQIHTEKDRIESVNGDSILGLTNNKYESIGGETVINYGGTKAEILSDDWSLTGKNIEFNLEGDFRVACKNMTINATDSVTITTTAGPITITSAGQVFVKGTQIRLND
jgi:hypothetical protein